MAQTRSCLVPAGLSVIGLAQHADDVTITAAPTAGAATCPMCVHWLPLWTPIGAASH
jgi:hypothetical protein